MKVGLVFGGRSVEHVVSVRSARTVLDALRTAGHAVTALGIAESGAWLPADVSMRCLEGNDKALPASTQAPRASLAHLLSAPVDVAFPIVHGTYGEDGTMQGLFEMLDLPYVGCGVLASAVAMDKLMSKHLFEAAGLPTVPWTSTTRLLFERDPRAALAATATLDAPLFVKPAVGGSSVGCRLVKDRTQLVDAVRFALRFDDTALVEKGVAAREIEVAVLGGTADLLASAIGEIVPGNDFYDYEDKYLKDDAKLVAPAPLDQGTADEVKRLGVLAMNALGGSGLARVDFFLVGNQLFLNEINTLPGFTSISMYPRLWALAGVPLPELVDRLVRIGVARHHNKARIDESLKEFVASVKS
jgi:D-alanine-D-alanine ligase